MLPGRIEAYLHSDGTTQNKMGSLVRVLCSTDFAAREFQFKEFAQKVAKLACGFQVDSWDGLILEIPAIEQDRQDLEKYLQEKITVDSITLLSL